MIATCTRGGISRAPTALALAACALACTTAPTPAPPLSYDSKLAALGECKPWAATVSGVAFSDAEATNTLAFVQNGTAAQLDAVSSIGPTLAAALIGARPYGTGVTGLQQLDAVAGIGPTVLAALKAQTPTVWCPVAGCCTPGGGTPPPAQPLPVINEFSPGSAGWIEIYNPGTQPFDLAGWSVDDLAGAGAAPKKLTVNVVVAAKGYLVTSYAGINAASVDSVRLLDPTGAEVDILANGYQGVSQAGACRGRAPDGGALAPITIACSPGKANPGPVVPPTVQVTINEFRPGSFGWVELYNPNNAQAPLLGWSIDDKAGDPSPPVLLGSLPLADKGYLAVAFGGLSATSADELRLIDPNGKVVETRANGWTSGSLNGLCFGRLPDGGLWSPQALTCTQSATNQGPPPPPATAPKVTINEMAAGNAPWIEVYNAGSTPALTDHLIVQTTAQKVGDVPILQFLGGKTELPPNSRTQVPLPMSWLPSKQAAAIVLIHQPVLGGPKTVLDQVGNGWQTGDITGKCRARLPDGGPWYANLVACTPSATNGSPAACTVGAACNDGNPCTQGEVFAAGCGCGGGKAPTCDDGNPCTDNLCGLDNGCANPDSANGSPCGSGQTCNFGNCAGADPNVCTAKGGTYKGVVFTAEQECKALQFLNKAPSSAFAWTTALIKVAYDCTPAGTCGYRKGSWTSLVQLTEKVGTCSSSFGTSTMQAIKDQSAAWVPTALPYDTVASTWTNKDKLGGRIITIESALVEKAVKGTFANCWLIRDKAGASNFLHACYAPDNFCDGCQQSCSVDCLGSSIGQKVWLRGILESDSALPGGIRLMLLKGLSCGNNFVAFAANPAVP